MRSGLDPVAAILKIRTEIEMVWIDAERIVASVKNVGATGYRAAKGGPRRSMSFPVFPIVGELRVVLWRKRLQPQPASAIRLRDAPGKQNVG